jgi:hypothetical protein
LTLAAVTLVGDERDARVRPRYTRLVADPFGYANPQDIVLDRTSTRSPAKTRPGLSCRFRPTGSTEVIIDRTRQPRGATWSLISRSPRRATTYRSTCSRSPMTLRVESRGQSCRCEACNPAPLCGRLGPKNASKDRWGFLGSLLFVPGAVWAAACCPSMERTLRVLRQRWSSGT